MRSLDHSKPHFGTVLNCQCVISLRIRHHSLPRPYPNSNTPRNLFRSVSLRRPKTPIITVTSLVTQRATVLNNHHSSTVHDRSRAPPTTLLRTPPLRMIPRRLLHYFFMTVINARPSSITALRVPKSPFRLSESSIKLQYPSPMPIRARAIGQRGLRACFKIV